LALNGLYSFGENNVKTDSLFLNQNRLLGDIDADQLIKEVFASKKQSELYAALQLPEMNILSLQDASPVSAFLQSPKTLPEWYDANRILKGQQVFELYAEEMMALLGAMALPYCYAASPGNKALYFSDKMRQSPGKRLLDTASFLINVSTPHSLEGDKPGHIHINKTRLIHALARYYILKGEWNMEWGLPINQEDMAGTNLAFSVIIVVGLQQSGFTLSEKQMEDFIFLWRYIGYQLAIDPELLPTSFQEAYKLAKLIRKRNFKKSMEGIELTRELLQYYRSVVPPNQAKFINAQVRHYIGPEVSDYLGLEADPVLDTINEAVTNAKTLQNLFSIQQSSFASMMANHKTLQKLITKK
jgi:ACT domain-containing protein